MNIKFLQNFFSKKKGSATGIALGFSAGIFAVSLGTVAIVGNTVQENKNVEDSSIAYFSAERGLENSLLSLSGHLSGYEIDELSENGLLKTKNKEAKTDFSIQSRSEADIINKKIILPIPGNGSSPDDNEWNILKKGNPSTIPLYIDNTAN